MLITTTATRSIIVQAICPYWVGQKTWLGSANDAVTVRLFASKTRKCSQKKPLLEAARPMYLLIK